MALDDRKHSMFVFACCGEQCWGAGQALATSELFAAEGSEQYWGDRSRISFVRATYFVRLLLAASSNHVRPVAQWLDLERPTFNRVVTGSSPAMGTVSSSFLAQTLKKAFRYRTVRRT